MKYKQIFGKFTKQKTCFFVERMDSFDETSWKCSSCGEEWYFPSNPSPEECNYKYCCECGAKILGYKPFVEEEDEKERQRGKST